MTMSKKRKKTIYDGKRLMTDEELEAFMNEQRVRILAKFVEREFIENESFRNKIEMFMDGNIKDEIMQGLDEEFKVLRDNPDDENVLNMVDVKVKNFIKNLYR